MPQSEIQNTIRRFKLNKILTSKEASIFITLVVFIIFVAIRNPNFINPHNFYDIINDSSILLLAASGQFLIILTGGIDLSVASGVALVGMSVGMINQYVPGLPLELVVLSGVMIGLVLGAINGLLVSVGRIPPIITTLGTMSIYRGAVFVLSKGNWVNADNMTLMFKNFVNMKLFGISTLMIMDILCILVFYLFTKHTKTGREIYGVGGNENASIYAGINVKKIKFIVYAINGVIVGLCGYLWVARYASAQNETASGFELQTIAACVIGGVSIAGGSGSIIGVILGTLFMGILYNALTQINISPFWQMAIQGFVILAAIVFNTVVDRKNQEKILKRRSL